MGQLHRRAGQVVPGLVSAFLIASCDSSAAGPSSSNVASVTFATSTVTISQGETFSIVPTAKDAAGNVLNDVEGIAWASGNATIVSVTQSGQIRGEALGGPVTITASINGVSGEAAVTVIPARVAFIPPDSNIVLGATLQLSGALIDHAGAPISANAEVVWASSNPDVATIGSASGLLTAVSSGETAISATAAGRTTTRKFHIGVPSAYDGRWSGHSDALTVSQGRTVTTSFEVIFGKVYSFELKLSHAFVVVAGSIHIDCPFTLRATASTASTIADDAFTTTAAAAGGPTSTITGTFTSGSTLTGTHTAISFGPPPDPFCARIGNTVHSPATSAGASTITATRAP